MYWPKRMKNQVDEWKYMMASLYSLVEKVLKREISVTVQ